MSHLTFKPVEPPDLHHLNGAEGWLELGNHAEAERELELISPHLRAHPMVLKVRWQVHARARAWFMAVVIGETLVKLEPDNSFGWIHRSRALGEMKRTQEAWDKLWPAAVKFPQEPIIPYNLARYACQLGLLGQARRYLRKALTLGEGARLKSMAKDDPALKPIWNEIEA